MQAQRSGFTLVELSIVLVIIALLVGGIIVGQSLIKSSQMQSAISDVNRFKSAIKLFRDKYTDLPGNKPNATTAWGTDPNGCTSPTNNDTPKVATCNGSGNGFIGGSDGTPINIGSNSHESLHAWQHLADAGMLDGNYSGAASAKTGGYNGGINVPVSKLGQNLYSLSYAGPTGVNGNVNAQSGAFGSNYGHIIVFGQSIPTGRPANGAGLTAEDALSLDSKIDDGQPGTGNVLSYTNTGLSPTTSCASSAVENTATYSVGTPGLICSLIFVTGF